MVVALGDRNRCLLAVALVALMVGSAITSPAVASQPAVENDGPTDENAGTDGNDPTGESVTAPASGVPHSLTLRPIEVPPVGRIAVSRYSSR